MVFVITDMCLRIQTTNPRCFNAICYKMVYIKWFKALVYNCVYNVLYMYFISFERYGW